VGTIGVVRGKPLFRESAMAAVRQWKYKPARLNGEAVASTIEVVINFTSTN